mmetsp:Transcript_103904/g.289500  ORF Transcript_103904/g.289500 Transcript_103904/m.289500 type:complete len:575 (-) Transcript_103904:130-1854(-)
MAQTSANQASYFTKMDLYKYLASSEVLERASADQQRQIKELCSSAAMLKKKSQELKKVALNVTQHLDAACRENTHLLNENEKLRMVLFTAAGVSPAAAMSASTGAAPSGLELDRRLRNIVHVARTSLGMVGLGETAWEAGGPAENSDLEQQAREEDGEEVGELWPAGLQVAQEHGHIADNDLKVQEAPPSFQHGPIANADFRQGLEPGRRLATQQAAAPHQPAALWQGAITKVTDVNKGVLGGQPWHQEAACSNGPQMDMTHSIFAGLEQALRQSQEAGAQAGLAAQVQQQQGGSAVSGSGASVKLFQGPWPDATSQGTVALPVASVQRAPPPAPEAAGPPRESPARGRLQATIADDAAQQCGLADMPVVRAAGTKPAAGWSAPQVLALNDNAPAAVQQSVPLQPTPPMRAPLPPGPVGSTHPVTAPLGRCTSQKQLSLHSPGTTTLTIRNVPGRYSQDRLIEEWGPECSYDFLHLPYSLTEQRSKGFALVNFASHEAALAFQRRWHGQRLTLHSRTRPLDIVMAPVQGYWANLMCMRNSLGGSKGYSDGLLPAVFHGSSRLDTRAELQKLPPP